MPILWSELKDYMRQAVREQRRVEVETGTPIIVDERIDGAMYNVLVQVGTDRIVILPLKKGEED